MIFAQMVEIVALSDFASVLRATKFSFPPSGGCPLFYYDEARYGNPDQIDEVREILFTYLFKCCCHSFSRDICFSQAEAQAYPY